MTWLFWLVLGLTILVVLVFTLVIRNDIKNKVPRELVEQAYLGGCILFIFFCVFFWGIVLSTMTVSTKYEELSNREYSLAKNRYAIFVTSPGLPDAKFTDVYNYDTLEMVPCLYVKKYYNGYNCIIDKEIVSRIGD
jgi:hypothetical protein